MITPHEGKGRFLKMVGGNTLVFYKKSAYKIYFLSKGSSFKKGKIPPECVRRFKETHLEHYHTLSLVERILKKYGIKYHKSSRGRKIDFGRYDFIITVGGDGTLLEAAQKVRKQIIIGVNSSPSFSIGNLCVAQSKNFERILRLILNNEHQIIKWQRLKIRLNGVKQDVESLNDILVCHSNPAAMTRYYLEIDGIKEEQRSSGIWIATPVGSSGAIKSSGGRLLNPCEKKIQYMPRELYSDRIRRYRLKGGILHPGQDMRIISLIRQGIIAVDGAHFMIPFPYGSILKVSLSSNPIKTIQLK